jgi:hypothetical protein
MELTKAESTSSKLNKSKFETAYTPTQTSFNLHRQPAGKYRGQQQITHWCFQALKTKENLSIFQKGSRKFPCGKDQNVQPTVIETEDCQLSVCDPKPKKS